MAYWNRTENDSTSSGICTLRLPPNERTLDKREPERSELRSAVLLFREWHIVAVGIILAVVGIVGQRVGDVIRLCVVSHALVGIGRLDRFVIVCVCVRRGVALLGGRVVTVRRIWRRVVRG